MTEHGPQVIDLPNCPRCDCNAHIVEDGPFMVGGCINDARILHKVIWALTCDQDEIEEQQKQWKGLIP